MTGVYWIKVIDQFTVLFTYRHDAIIFMLNALQSILMQPLLLVMIAVAGNVFWFCTNARLFSCHVFPTAATHGTLSETLAA